LKDKYGEGFFAISDKNIIGYAKTERGINGLIRRKAAEKSVELVYIGQIPNQFIERNRRFISITSK